MARGDFNNERPRLRAMITHRRLQSIQSELSVASWFCALAESELDYGQVAEAQELVDKVRNITECVCARLDELDNVPSRVIADVSKEVAELETRIASVELQIAH